MLNLGSEAMLEIAENITSFELKIERLMGQKVKVQIVELEERPDRNVWNEFKFMNRVIEVTAACGRVSEAMLKGKSHETPLPDLRYIAYTIIKDKFPKASQKSIGEVFGGRDHSSVAHGLKQFNDLWHTEPSFRMKFLTIKKALGDE